MRSIFDNARNERGAAALEFAMAVPLLALTMAASLDLGAYIHAATSAGSAATAGVRYLANHPDATGDEETLRSYLAASYPDLGFDTGASTVAIDIIGQESTPFDYRLYDSDEFVSLPTTSACDHVRVTVTSAVPWPAAPTLLENENGRFTVTATRDGDADRTDGTSWQ